MVDVEDGSDFDLYDDVINPFFSVQKVHDTGPTENNIDETPCQSSQPEESSIVSGKGRAQVENLQSVNTALKKNISCLFKTAKLELERKDSEIEKLKSEITNLHQMVKHMCSQRLPQPVATTPPPSLAIPPSSSSFFINPYQTMQDNPCSLPVTSLTSQEDYLYSQNVADMPLILNGKETLSPATTNRERGGRKRQKLSDEGDNKCELQNGRSPLSSCENGGRREERDDHKESRLSSEKKRDVKKHSLSCESKKQRPSRHTRVGRSRSPCSPVFLRSRSNSSHRRERSSSVSSPGRDCLRNSSSRLNGRERSRSPHERYREQEHRQRSRSPHEHYMHSDRPLSPHEWYREQERRQRSRSPHGQFRELRHRERPHSPHYLRELLEPRPRLRSPHERLRIRSRSPHELSQSPHYLPKEQEHRRRSRSPHEREYRDRLRTPHSEPVREKERYPHRTPESQRKQEGRTTREEHHTPIREREARLRPVHISRNDSRGSDERREIESPKLRSSRNSSGSSLADHRGSESNRELRKTESSLRQHEHDLRTKLDKSENRQSARLKSKTSVNDRSRKTTLAQSRSSLRSKSCTNKTGPHSRLKLSPVPSSTTQEASPSLSPTEQLLLETSSFPVLSEDGLLISDSPIKKQLNSEQKTSLSDGINRTCTTQDSPRKDDRCISTKMPKPQSNGSLQTAPPAASSDDEFEEGEILSD